MIEAAGVKLREGMANGGAAVDFGPLHESVGTLLRLAQINMFEAFFARFGDRGLRPGQFTILATIGQNPGIRQGAVADALKVKWSNMAKIVRTLEERDLLRRDISPDDRRAVELTLTAQGERLVADVLPEVLAYEREALPVLTDSEYGTLRQLLSKMAGWSAGGEALPPPSAAASGDRHA